MRLINSFDNPNIPIPEDRICEVISQLKNKSVETFILFIVFNFIMSESCIKCKLVQ